MKDFIGRKKEFDYLTTLLLSGKSELITLSGRRRLGKTRLLKEVLSSKLIKSNSVYYLSVQESSLKNLDYFKEVLSLSLNNPLLKEITSTSWSDYFRLAISQIPSNFTIVLDEFPYLIYRNTSILSHFQKLYDEYLKPKNINLVLCGSSSSIMSDLMSYQSPLYGRRTGTIHLKELTFYDSSLFLKTFYTNFGLYELSKLYLLLGGVPYYFEQINQNISFNDNFINLFFKNQSIFLDEVQFMLKEEFKEVRNYLAIFKSIAKGKNKFSEIAQDAYIDKSSLSKYLIHLESLNLVENIKSFFDKQNSKKTIYRICDSFIFIWFAVISPKLSNLDNISVQNNILKIHLPHAFGFLFEQFSASCLSSNYESVGTYFRDVEIDILGKVNNTITCFECKYRSISDEKKELVKLKEKTLFLPDNYTYKFKLISLDKGITLTKLLQLSKN